MIDTPDNPGGEGEQTEKPPTSLEEWKSVATHPDPVRDLGYDLVDWETIRTPSHSDHVVYLPTEDELLEDATFIVAGPDGRCELADRR